jgi:hypothetical protein
MVNEKIPHDGEKPGTDIGTLHVFFLVHKGPVHGFLVKVPCGFRISGKHYCKRLQEVRLMQQQVSKFGGRHLLADLSHS